MNGIALFITGLMLFTTNKHYTNNEVLNFVDNHMEEKYGDFTNFEHIQDIKDSNNRKIGSLVSSEDIAVIFIEDSDDILGVTGYKIYDNVQSKKIEADLKTELSLYGIDCKSLNGYSTYDGGEEYNKSEHLEELMNSCYNVYYTGDNLEEVINDCYKTDKFKRTYEIDGVIEERKSDINDIIMNLKYKIDLDINGD